MRGDVAGSGEQWLFWGGPLFLTEADGRISAEIEHLASADLYSGTGTSPGSLKVSAIKSEGRFFLVLGNLSIELSCLLLLGVGVVLTVQQWEKDGQLKESVAFRRWIVNK